MGALNGMGMVRADSMSDITLTPSQISLIRLMAEYDMNREAVSRVLGCHRNTVTYRLDGIMKITKYDPRVFYDLVELIGLVGRGEAG